MSSDDETVKTKTGAAEPVDHILQFFEYRHLPDELGSVSQRFAELAHHVVGTLPRNPERTVALRKLLEAKDAAVRAKMAKPVEAPPYVPST